MKAIVKKSSKKAGWTIVELLTVMSIIIILIGLLVPGLNKAKQFARKVKQKAQFHSIDVAMDLFSAEEEGYPNSDALGGDDKPYCGAMKLCEAMVGQDLLGFHPASRFRSDGTDGSSSFSLYKDHGWSAEEWEENLKSRKGPYLKLESANAFRMKDLYKVPPLSSDQRYFFVLCDVYTRVINIETGKRVGMPLLYYKANTSLTAHDVTHPDNPENIYNYKDNDELVKLGMPWEDPPPAVRHELDEHHEKFYEMTKNENIILRAGRPYRSDSYILISAGFDGEYGTPDDVLNFEK